MNNSILEKREKLYYIREGKKKENAPWPFQGRKGRNSETKAGW